MWRHAQWILGGTLVAAGSAPARPHPARFVAGSALTRPHPARFVSHEVIVVYVGVNGVDRAMVGLADSVRLAVARQIAASGQHLILRGVSLDPEVGTGVRDLAQVGVFDEISVGGNWTNSAVVHYLGGDIGKVYPETGVPQVIVLARDVDNQITALHVGPERELARYIGSTVIWDWARRGARLSK